MYEKFQKNIGKSQLWKSWFWTVVLKRTRAIPCTSPELLLIEWMILRNDTRFDFSGGRLQIYQRHRWQDLNLRPLQARFPMLILTCFTPFRTARWQSANPTKIPMKTRCDNSYHNVFFFVRPPLGSSAVTLVTTCHSWLQMPPEGFSSHFFAYEKKFLIKFMIFFANSVDFVTHL